LIRLLEGIKNNGNAVKNKTSSGSSSSIGKRGSTARNSFRIAQEIFAQQQQQQNQSNNLMTISSEESPPNRTHSSSSSPSSLVVIQGRAMCSYEAKPNSNEVSFKGGDILHIQNRIDANWSYGTVVSSGRTGLFPSSLVQVLANLQSQPQVISNPVVRALYDFSLDEREREGRDCLSFKKNDIIRFIRRVDENWASGRLGDQTGIFPLNFVEVSPSVAMILRQQPYHDSSMTSNSLPSISNGTNNTKIMQTYGSINCNANNNDMSNSNNNDHSRQEDQYNTTTHPKSSGVNTTTANIIYDVVSSSSPCQSTIVKSETKPFITSLSLNGTLSYKTIDDKKHKKDNTQVMMIMSSNSNGTTNGVEPSSSGNIESIMSNNHSPQPHPSLFSHQSIETVTPLSLRLSSTDPKEVVSERQANNDHADYSGITAVTTHTNHKRHSLCAPIVDPVETSATSSNVVVLHQRSVSHTPSGTSVNPRYSMDVESSFGRQHDTPEAFPSPPISSTGQDRSTYGSTGLVSPKPMVTASALYTAMFDYKPSKLDELELVRGRLYCVSEKCLDGWYRGSCLRTNASGVFPGNYVQIVKPTTPASQHSSHRHSNNETQPMTAADSRFSAVYHTPGRGIPKDARYQTIYPSSSSSRTMSSSPPPLRPKTFGWKSSELLSSDTRTTSNQSSHRNASSSQLYAKPAKTRTLPLNFSSRRSRKSKSPSSRDSDEHKTAATTANTPSPQWQSV
jgi:hypothetical protein